MGNPGTARQCNFQPRVWQRSADSVRRARRRRRVGRLRRRRCSVDYTFSDIDFDSISISQRSRTMSSALASTTGLT